VATTFVKIQTVTVGSGGSKTMGFTSIPQTFTDLKVVISGRGTRAANDDDVLVSFNSSTSNFTGRFLYGNGAGAFSASTGARFVGSIPSTSSTASIFGNTEFYIPNYTSSNYKSYSADSVTENNGTTAYQLITAGLWSDTAAITGITLTSNVGDFVQYSTATLYGIKNT
jgi:hypothetical protein